MNTQENYKQKIEEAARKIIGEDCKKENCLQCGGSLSVDVGCVPYRRMIELANWLLSNLWISVEEALPEIVDGYRSALVIVRSKYNSYDVAKWDEYYKDWVTPYYTVANVTHWMPIPKTGGEG